ncbi:hypothetical protein ACJIZ3_009441 [Penstemon smallii]|uniref:Bifunctional inhibitor/plant lipid transfer protein/seed storage helical domain-containing protein n=1 Tax=Penstemon smallii TaxID=265156 RepID=A0ABD3TDC7_9LAMI
MKVSFTISSWFAIVMILVASIAIGVVLGQSPTPSECAQEKNQLKHTCRAVIFGQNPSAPCCQLVRAAHAECVCPFLTPKLAVALRGAQRIIRMVGGCGREVPRSFKCGSVTTPP